MTDIYSCRMFHLTCNPCVSYRDQWGNPSDEISGTGAIAVLLEQQLCCQNQPSLLKVVSVEIETYILDPFICDISMKGKQFLKLAQNERQDTTKQQYCHNNVSQNVQPGQNTSFISTTFIRSKLSNKVNGFSLCLHYNSTVIKLAIYSCYQVWEGDN